MTRVLVAYASKMGSTRGIAAAIAEELQNHGLRAEVENVVEVSSLDYYDAVVLGSAVYAGRWRREAARFLKRHHDELARRPVWLFESGWVGTKPDKLVPTSGGCARAARIGAAEPAVFGGRLDPTTATGWLARTMAKKMPGDSRNFDEIRAWAATVADTVTATAQG